MSIFNTISNLFHRGEQKVAQTVKKKPTLQDLLHATIGAARAANPVVNNAVEAAQQIRHVIPHVSQEGVGRVINNVANTHLTGLEQLTNKPVTVKTAASHIPIVGDAARFCG
jgi:hypothetical protein